MTPQAFSYPVVGNDGIIYVPPYGLLETLDYMISIDPNTYDVEKINIEVDNSKEKWTNGIVNGDNIFWLPYAESTILMYDTAKKTASSIKVNWPNGTENIKGKFIQGHLHNGWIIALPYGEEECFDYILKFNTFTLESTFIKIEIDNNDWKKWHQSVLWNNELIALPRGERWDKNYFNYAIRFNCDLETITLVDLNYMWPDFVAPESEAHKKFTTVALGNNNKVYAPPYSGTNPDFDFMVTFNGEWTAERTGIRGTSRKYFTHVKSKNGKLVFPPAGHDVDWNQMLIIDSIGDTWKTMDIPIGEETKKYFAGAENSQGKITFIPRGGCVCEDESDWKRSGDLAQLLIVDTLTDEYHLVDVSEYFKDNTTIEKYNSCVIINDVIFALPYGESESFQTVLVFDTIQEKVIKVIDLNEL